MRGIILLQNGFEDTEGLTTIDILRRAKIDVTLVNMSNSEIITTQYNNNLIINSFYKDIKLKEFDFLIIPGGGAVSKQLIDDKRVYEAIKYFYSNNKLIAAICAAPVLLKEYLTNKEYTCFPSYKNQIDGYYSDLKVVKTDNIITAKSMYYTVEFALEIVKYLTNLDLEKSLKGE